MAGCDKTTQEDTLTCLQGLSAEKLQSTSVEAQQLSGDLFAFNVIQAGPAFPGVPAEIYAAGEENKIDLMAGVATHECYMLYRFFTILRKNF